jgi:xanthine dehydrogenase accessory factor
MDRRLTREALRLLDRHEPFVRATVVRTRGSVPGKLGASMIVRRDGSTVGTVGGAALEETVKARAAEVFVSGRGDLHHFDLQTWREGGLPSLCGGSVDIALEFAAARPRVLLWGAGHVAHAIAGLLPTLEYDYCVADDRAEWLGVDRFPDAERRETIPPAELWTTFEPDGFTHLYVLGYDAAKDAEVLYRSLESFPNYIGLISSASKRTHLFAGLRARGVTDVALARVRAPIGLPIGAETPAEIAVSVVAEIVQSMHPVTDAAPRRKVRASAPSASPSPPARGSRRTR